MERCIIVAYGFLQPRPPLMAISKRVPSLSSPIGNRKKSPRAGYSIWSGTPQKSHGPLLWGGGEQNQQIHPVGLWSLWN